MTVLQEAVFWTVMFGAMMILLLYVTRNKNKKK